MCLTLKSNNVRVHVATKDIVCYKVLIERRNYFNDFLGYVTYYQRALVRMDKIYTSRLVMRRFDHELHPDIQQGLHTFKTLKRAEQFIIGTALCRIAKCIIPAGSKYYVGKFDQPDNYRESYASDTLKYVEIIK